MVDDGEYNDSWNEMRPLSGSHNITANNGRWPEQDGKAGSVSRIGRKVVAG
jgi:hypothetical protein